MKQLANIEKLKTIQNKHNNEIKKRKLNLEVQFNIKFNKKRIEEFKIIQESFKLKESYKQIRTSRNISNHENSTLKVNKFKSLSNSN